MIFWYFLFNLLLTVHNKVVLSGFRYPWIISGIHILISGIGAFCLDRDQKSSGRNYIIVIIFSILYTVNIGMSNLSLSRVSFSFHQIMRSTSPVMTICLESIFLKKHQSKRILLSIAPVVVGVSMATFSDVQVTVWGFLLTFLGVFLSALKGILTNIILTRTSLQPLEIIWRMAPICILQCMLLSFVHESTPESFPWSNLAVNGILAFLLNWASFTANKNTSALTMTIAGNLKQVLSIIIGFYLFDSNLTPFNILGIFVALFGGFLYSFIKLKGMKDA